MVVGHHRLPFLGMFGVVATSRIIQATFLWGRCIERSLQNSNTRPQLDPSYREFEVPPKLPPCKSSVKLSSQHPSLSVHMRLPLSAYLTVVFSQIVLLLFLPIHTRMHLRLWLALESHPLSITPTHPGSVLCPPS